MKKITLQEKYQEVLQTGKGCFIIEFLDYFPISVQKRILKVKSEHLRFISFTTLARLNNIIILAELIMEGIDWGHDHFVNQCKESWSTVYIRLANFNSDLLPVKYLL
jgi:hypothetical protein